MTTTAANSDIELLLDSSEDDLLLSLGTAIMGKPALPPTMETLIANARHWLSSHRDILVKGVCANTQVRDVVATSGAASRRVDLVAAVADAIVGAVSGVPVVVVSVLLVKEGIHNICVNHWGA